jgi:hypothetical protein
MKGYLIVNVIFAMVCKPRNMYWNGETCATNGVHSVNEFGANICDYPSNVCNVVRYFTYQEGGNSVELCCETNSDCNYAKVKNYCHPDLKRCTDSFFFNCSSEKGVQIFESCL